MVKPTLTKVVGRYDWRTTYYTQHMGVVFCATKMEFDMPVRSTCWRVEASRPVLPCGKKVWDFDTLAEVREFLASDDLAVEITSANYFR